MTPLPEPSPFQRSRRMVLLHSHADIKSVNEIRSIVFTREPPDKLKSISYGKERPVCTESNEECWQRNRRAHFSAGQ